MSFRTRLLAAFLPAVLLPMMVVSFIVFNKMAVHLTQQYEQRVASLIEVIGEDLARQNDVIMNALIALQKTMTGDERFRRAAVDDLPEERLYLTNYARNVMELTGLSMLLIQDRTGQILSSGHFHNEFGRRDPGLPKLLETTAEGMALVLVRAPDAPFLALARTESFTIDGKKFTLVAGIKIGSSFLARLIRDTDVEVSLNYPGGSVSLENPETVHVPEEALARGGNAEIMRELRIPFIGSERKEIAPAQIRVSHPLGELQALRKSIRNWFLAAMGAASLFAIFLATFLASRISRPLAQLAQKTSDLDLDRLDIDFTSERKDEIGTLSRLLGVLAERLRISTLRIKEAQRRATLGELARQVNHDIKNGLIPIRNAFRHLAQLAREDPAQLPEVFRERQRNIESSVAYLENLATNYARLYPKKEARPCDVNTILREVVRDMQGGSRADFEMKLHDGAVVKGDPVALRRIFENLVDNAIDSLDSRLGTITITTQAVDGDRANPLIRVTVADTGKGMSEQELARAFEHFYTTKKEGTGLGLSIVRQLVSDLEGSIHAQSTQGVGSSFIVDFPPSHETRVPEESGTRGRGGQ